MSYLKHILCIKNTTIQKDFFINKPLGSAHG